MQKLNLVRRLVVGAALTLAAVAHAAPYSGLFVFGDSLSDAGNNALAIGTDPGQIVTGDSYIPSFPYASGTYSNGPVWATSLASSLGLSALPSLAGGTNYAFGGATTGPAGSSFPFSLRDQVSTYLASAAGVAAADGLYVIAGGGNNARAALTALSAPGSDPLAIVTAASAGYADDVGFMVDALQAAGARRIVVWNTPDLGLAPAVTSMGAVASATGTFVSSAMNAALAARLLGETDVLTFDLFALLGDAVAAPGAFGLSNATDACGALVGCDASSYLFWDGIHPTSGGHALLARTMLAVVPEPGAAWLAISALGLLLLTRRARD